MEQLIQNHTVSGKFWHALDDGRIQCDLCPRYCKLKEGQRGLCYVRANQNHQMVLTTYGLSSGFCIDPIEKKPLNHFLPGTPTFSFGTAGCNLSCKFCQNWDISKSREIETLSQSASPETIAKTAKKYGCRSVAFTYNDPVIFYEYAKDVAEACHQENIKTVAVTAGYITEQARPAFFEFIDAANIDLKSFSEKFYQKLCAGHLQPVLDTLLYLKKETSVWFEITTLLIPGENDSKEELNEMTKWIVNNLGPDVPLHFSAFHPDYKLTNKPFTALDTLL
ncbi:MAG: AmmeMemoRadiSam system radical SAM enzyme, partial [Bdellovibrio sp.]